MEHRGDISGWTFLASLPATPDERKAVLAETMKVAKQFQYCNESVWWFFKAVASSSEERAELATLRTRLLPDADELDRQHLARIGRWLEEADVAGGGPARETSTA